MSSHTATHISASHFGHQRNMTVDNGVPADYHIDRRLAPKNRDSRTNITRHHGKVRGNIVTGKSMEGTHYNKHKRCTRRGVLMARRLFKNLSMRKEDRRNNSLNSRCRGCQKVQHTKDGYLEDGFVVNDDVDDEEADEPAVDETDEKEADEPAVDETEYPVEGFVDYSFVDSGLQLLVKWVGYDEPTWEPASEMPTEMVLDYMGNIYG